MQKDERPGYHYAIAFFPVALVYMFTTLSCYYQTFLTEILQSYPKIMIVHIIFTIILAIALISVDGHLRKRAYYLRDNGADLLSWMCLPLYLGLFPLLICVPLIAEESNILIHFPISIWMYAILLFPSLIITTILNIFVYVLQAGKRFEPIFRRMAEEEERQDKAEEEVAHAIITVKNGKIVGVD